MTKIIIDGGDVFEGNFDQFEDCFFSFEEGSDEDDKIEQIEEWCLEEDFELEIERP